MKRLAKVLVCVVAFSLIVATTVLAAHTGVKGRLWDSSDPAQPWEYGARVVALECTSDGEILDQVYACDNASTDPAGWFDFAWGTNNCAGVSLNDTAPAGPSGKDTMWVCLYVIWNSGSMGQPPDLRTPPREFMEFITDRMNFGNIQSGTGPVALTLTGLSTESINFWLPAGLAAISLVAVGAVVMGQKRRQ